MKQINVYHKKGEDDGNFVLYNKTKDNYRKINEKYTIGVCFHDDDIAREVVVWCKDNIKKYKIDIAHHNEYGGLWVYFEDNSNDYLLFKLRWI